MGTDEAKIAVIGEKVDRLEIDMTATKALADKTAQTVAEQSVSVGQLLSTSIAQRDSIQALSIRHTKNATNIGWVRTILFAAIAALLGIGVYLVKQSLTG